VREEQTVLQMVEEVLSRQAQTRAKRTGEPFEEALKAVLETEAGRQLGELRDRSHRHDGAREWQESLPRERAEERLRHFGLPVPAEIPDARPPPSVADRHYSWLEGYLAWLDDKEGRSEYHVWLGQELGRLKGKLTGPGCG
jgi:hypothetical protein